MLALHVTAGTIVGSWATEPTVEMACDKVANWPCWPRSVAVYSWGVTAPFVDGCKAFYHHILKDIFLTSLKSKRFLERKTNFYIFKESPGGIQTHNLISGSQGATWLFLLQKGGGGGSD